MKKNSNSKQPKTRRVKAVRTYTATVAIQESIVLNVIGDIDRDDIKEAANALIDDGHGIQEIIDSFGEEPVKDDDGEYTTLGLAEPNDPTIAILALDDDGDVQTTLTRKD